MSWEIMGSNVKPCLCGKGNISRELESDDWNRRRTQVSINCEDCVKNFYLETRWNATSKGVSYETEFLIPIYVKFNEVPSFQRLNKPSNEGLCNAFSKSELKQVLKEIGNFTSIKSLTNSSEATNDVLKYFGRIFRTKKIIFVKEQIYSAIQKYDEFDNSWDSQESIAAPLREKNKKLFEKYSIKI